MTSFKLIISLKALCPSTFTTGIRASTVSWGGGHNSVHNRNLFSILWSLAGWSGTGVGLHNVKDVYLLSLPFEAPIPSHAPRWLLRSAFQPAGGREGRAETLPSTKGTCQKLHRPIPLTSHWPEFNHMATPGYKVGENVSLYKTRSACLKFWFYYWHLHKPNLINEAFTCMEP